MKLLVNNTEVIIPSSLQEITLQQKIDYEERYGKALMEQFESILAMDDEFERELEATQHEFEKMFKTFAFFSGIDEDTLKESEFIDRIASVYYSCANQLKEEEEALELKQEFLFNDEVWVLDHPELKHGDRMKFGEFIDAKQIISDMHALSKNRWEALVPLCAIFLRKKDEPYDPEFTYDDSERMKLMRTLPLDIAIVVGFFLSSSLNLLITAFRYSDRQELKAEDVSLLSI